MKKRVLKIVLLFILVFALLCEWMHIYHFKYGDGISDMEIFYSQPKDSIDVMVFGSSHAFENVNTAELWKKYGMASYVLAGSVQPIWNTYYYMKEALKYQKPKVMVVDMYTAVMDNEYGDDSRVIKNVYGMKPSIDKINAVKASAPKELWNQYLFEYPSFHTRYSEITQSDYSKYGDDITNSASWKGFGANFATTPASFIDISNISKKRELTTKNKEFVDKIINLSKKSGIPMVFTVSPYQLSEGEAMRYNSIVEIAQKNNIPILYCNKKNILDKLNLNLEKDYADSAHMNQLGNVKYTRFLADYLKKRYNIPDRTGNKKYYSYDIMLQDYERRVENNEIISCKNADSYLSMTLNDDYFVTVTADGMVSDQLSTMLKSKYTYPSVQSADFALHPIWVMDGKNLISESTDDKEYEYNISKDHYVLSIKRSKAPDSKNSDAIINRENAKAEKERSGEKQDNAENKALMQNSVFINKNVSKKVDDGINITIYDKYTKRMIECVGIKNDLQIVR